MNIFSYIFYTFSKIYRAGLDKRDPDVYACGLVSFLQWVNFYTIVKFFASPPYIVWGIMAGAMFLLNLFFFNYQTLEKFDKRWDNESKSQRFFKRLLVISYVVATFAIPIYLYG
ncbi:hypothetical protein FACS189437_07900 [Bacteroidia bacterium]|nr:hypothetical protein FACS189437_07900 [Bacteroidia bacterium]